MPDTAERRDDPEAPYRVEVRDRKFHVVDESGRLIVVCGDAGNAEQYAALLNGAHQRGYKAGFRAARRSGSTARESA